MPYSYNGWPASSRPDSINIVHFEPIKGYDFPGGIKGGAVRDVFTYLVRQLNERVEPIKIYPPGDEWGYNYRPNVNNPSQLSCHASGTAIDYNATEHPNKVDYTWTREQTREIHKIIDDELDGVIKWLEGYDEMHFEIRGSADAVAIVAKKIRDGLLPPQTTPPKPEAEEEEVARLVKGKDKGEWYVTDGVFKRHINDRQEAAELAFIGALKWNNGQPFVLSQQTVDDMTTVKRATTLT